MSEGASKDEALSRLECVESKFSAVCLAEFTPRAWVTPFGGGFVRERAFEIGADGPIDNFFLIWMIFIIL